MIQRSETISKQVVNSLILSDFLESSFNKEMSFYDFKNRERKVLESYLLEKVNYGIRKEEKKFNLENIALYLDTLGWSFQTLYEYISHIDKYQNVQGIILFFSLNFRLCKTPD